MPISPPVPIIGGFRYVPFAPVALAADTIDWVGMLATNTSSISDVTPTTAPQVTVPDGGQYTFTKPGATLQYPNDQI